MGRRIWSWAATALVLGACASGPEVSLSGDAGKPAPRTFRLASEGPVESLVSAALVKHGYSPAAGTAAADYTVQSAYAVRPMGVGAYLPGAAPADPPRAVLAATARKKFWQYRSRQAYSLVVEISETGSGRPVYRRKAASVARVDKAAELPPLLVAAALADLP